jgi:hypothetical protein
MKRFESFMAVKIQIEFFWVKNGSNMDLCNVGIPPQYHRLYKSPTIILMVKSLYVRGANLKSNIWRLKHATCML